MLWTFWFTGFVTCVCIMTLRSMNSEMKTLSISDEDFIDNCDYLETDSDLDHTLGLDNELNIIQLNIRGLFGKQNTLIQETTPNNPNKKIDIYILCETWLNEYNNGMIKIPNYSYIGNHRKNKKGGGVAILIHNTLTYKERTDIKPSSTSDLEAIFVELKTRTGNLIIGSMYRPPHTNEKNFLKDYGLLLKQLKVEPEKDILIGMDHNMDLLKTSKHKHTQNILDLNLDEDLLPTITKPTRITEHCATLLDNIFLSRRLQCLFVSGICLTDLSDHLPGLVCLKDLRHETTLQKTITYRIIHDDNIQDMNEELKTYNWNDVLAGLNTNDSFNVFHDIIVGAFNTHMPEKTKRISNKPCKHEPWMTKGIKKKHSQTKTTVYKNIETKK